NTSTKIPENTRAITGISCAYLVQNMERNNEGFTQMGSEGASWVGESVFSNTDHIFQNMGDGTYIHSGILSIRHAVAAKTKMTFKILYNDAVALTGGQALDGLPTVAQMSRQLESEGVKKIAIITDEPNKYKSRDKFSNNSRVYDRKEIIDVQIKLSQINDTTAIIYDQTCAAEKRRRIKKSILPEPNKKIFINEKVCEGCGDCGIQSNCISIVPVETEYGRKRQIDQSNCNKDYSCVDGFCPSFVSVVGDVKLKTNVNNSLIERINSTISEPILPEIQQSYGIMIAGIGGTGVVTIGAILATAAQIDGKGSGVLDMTGLAQKGGAVKSFLRIFNDPKEISTIRLSYGDTNLLMGFDLLVANDEEVLKTLDKQKTKSIINSDEIMTGEFTRDKNFFLPFDKMKENLINILGKNN
ncbi:MAG TPA: indolepyruvate ferredoxin oxidoreductase family protein, partial [Pelagibacterales bacterium]|nr:indolepyruvate ferredoxin oxidoreductase family protein [Pelagibacterales bacterium]